jgi:hypothetical protein
VCNRSMKTAYLVAPFLHEFTHHWCFSSLVGNALAFTELRVNALSGRLPQFRPLCARDYLAVNCLSALLRPIAEGMALFAEFDLEPSEWEFKSGTPLTAAELCFSAESGEPFSKLMWAQFRRDAAHIDRKASIYLNDFETQEGYLPGYMLVKSLFNAMIVKVPDITPELFLAYVRCFFWEDPGFVSLLTPNELHGPTVASDLRNRFLRRIDIFRLAQDLPERVADFWVAWSAKGQFHPGRGLYIEPEEETQAIAGFQAVLDATADALRTTAPAPDCKNESSVDDILKLYADLANFRRFTIVARTPLTVEKEGDRWAFILPANDGGTQRVYWPFVGPPPDGEYECFAVIPNFAGYMVVVLRSSEDVRLLNWIGHFDQTRHGAEVGSFVAIVDQVMACIKTLWQDFQAVGYAAIDSPSLRAILDAINKDSLDIYLALITRRGSVDPATVDNEMSLLRNSGLRSLFDADPLALRTVAAISLVDLSHASLHEFSREPQLSLAQLFLLPEENVNDMRRALERVFDRDKTRLVVAGDAERLRVLV